MSHALDNGEVCEGSHAANKKNGPHHSDRAHHQTELIVTKLRLISWPATYLQSC
jgi:hypothetical protein